jgi:DNA-binding transcriptional ArsR family regulator
MMLDHQHPVAADRVATARVATARVAIISTDDAGRLAGLLGLIQGPVRFRVLFALSAVDELCVGDLALALETTNDTVSYALKLLRTAGLVVFRKRGHVVFHRLSDDFPRQVIEHCLRQLLTIVVPEEA